MKLIRARTERGEVAQLALMPDGSTQQVDGGPFGPWRPTGRVVEAGQRLAPVQPTQVIGIGLNYAEHAAEGGISVPKFPVLFFKGVNSVAGPEDEIRTPYRAGSDKLDYEAELAVVIGRDCRDISREDALSYVAGYTCANDVSARDWQLDKGGSQWSRGKSFDSFCPLGPTLVTTDEISDPNVLSIRTFVNGEMVQNSNTKHMIFDIPALIEFLSADTTLVAGTVILTGTPEGVGFGRTPQRWLNPGDTVKVEIDCIGTLVNRVV